jgi:hypothetical protein
VDRRRFRQLPPASDHTKAELRELSQVQDARTEDEEKRATYDIKMDAEFLLAQWSPLWVKFGRKLAVRAESAFPPIADIVDYGRDLRRAFIRSWLRVYEFTH